MWNVNDKNAYNVVEQSVHFNLVRIPWALTKQNVAIAGKKFRRLCVGFRHSCHSILVDKLCESFVHRLHKSNILTEEHSDQSVEAPVYIENWVYILLAVLKQYTNLLLVCYCLHVKM